jgi:heptosyltransferase-2
MTHKILLIKRAALGDILMATPLIRQLKQKIPNIQLDFLVSDQFAGVLCNNKYIDNLITLPAINFSFKKIFTLLKFALKLRGKYDYVFILDKHYYFNFIARIISINTVGFVRETISRLLVRYQVLYNDVMRYHGLYYLDLLLASKLAIPDYTDYKLDFVISKVNDSILEQIMQDYGLKKNQFVLIINSGGNNQFESGGIRMLPQNKVLQLINKLSINTSIVLLGGKIDEINYNNYLDLVNGTNIINLAGKLSMEQSASLMYYASKIYTTDCGAMHIAISQGLFGALCCFFGPTCPTHVLPRGYGIEYYWADKELLDVRYPLYGTTPKINTYFATLNIDKLFLDSKNEIKKLY